MTTPASSKKNYLIAFLSLTTVVSAGFAIRQQLEVEALRKQEHLTVVASQPNEGPDKAFTEAPPPPAAEAAAPTEAAPPEAAPTEAQRNDRRQNFAARLAELQADPKFMESMKLQQRAQLDNRYAALFKQLNLPPDQLAKFKDLLIERETAMRDVMMAAQTEGIDGRENRDQLRQMAQALQAEVDASLKQTLGETAYATYESYNSSGRERGVVSQINQRLSYSGTSLSDTQSAQLVQIMQSNGGALNEQVINLARGMLTANQVTALQQVAEEQAAGAYVREKAGSFGWGGRGGRGGP